MKTLLLGLALFSSLTSYATEQKRVLMVVNEGFQPDEYYEPRKAFEAAGFKIKVASRFGGVVHPGKKYTTINPVTADFSFEQIDLNNFDAITFAGGGGAWSDYFPVKSIHKVLESALKKEGFIVGLICAGTGLLATANNLDGKTPIAKGRHITGYGEVEGLLRMQGQVNYDGGDPTKPYVVRDGYLITGRDPMSSKLFGETVTAALKNERI